MAFSPEQPGATRPVVDWQLEEAEREELTRRLRERRVRQRQAQRARRRRAQIRRRRLVALVLCGLVAFGVSALASGDPLGHAPSDPPPVARLTSLVAERSVVPGALGTVAWPSAGQGAMAVLGEGVMAASPDEQMVPIASLTKMMTALVVLHDHPIPLGGSGPSFTMTRADVAGWVHASQTDESNVPVRLGEVLTEQQLLEALLIPSADNVADLFATWDAGSVPAFVTKMNAMAHALGLRHTSYADASGVDPASRSTARDQAVVAATLMSNPVVRSIVSRPSLAFPVAGTIWNYNPALGTDGIIGVKSGYTSEAQGCLATAAYHTVGTHSVLVVTVALGQPDGLYGAARTDEGLLTRAERSLFLYRPTYAATVASETLGSAVTPLALAGAVPEIVAWPGLRLRTTLAKLSPQPVGGTNTTVAGAPGVPSAELVISGALGTLVTVPLVATTQAAGTETSDSTASAVGPGPTGPAGG